MPDITGVEHVELSVSDLERSTAWYRALFDAPEVFRAAQEEYGIVATAIREPGSGTVLAFTQHRAQEGGPFTLAASASTISASASAARPTSKLGASTWTTSPSSTARSATTATASPSPSATPTASR